MKALACLLLLAAACGAGPAVAQSLLPDTDRDILVTFENVGARVAHAGGGSPYRFRKRYAISREVRRLSRAVAAEHGLDEIDHWPIRSLSIYCFVYRVPDGIDRDAVIATLASDARVESAQRLQEFETRIEQGYNDPYAGMQYPLRLLGIDAAHRYTRGAGVRVAIIDSFADDTHEDLAGRIALQENFASTGKSVDSDHGTAVASVIGARSNNAVGIVGVAPEAALEIYVSCWREDDRVVCDSFSLSKALDRVLADPPEVINLSLVGPPDRLLGRLIEKAVDAGVVVVSARNDVDDFPASMDEVIAIERSIDVDEQPAQDRNALFAPGDEIIVAIPEDQYAFRSGSSLSAAHVSGVVALLRSAFPEQSHESIRQTLSSSQRSSPVSISACAALAAVDDEIRCAD